MKTAIAIFFYLVGFLSIQNYAMQPDSLHAAVRDGNESRVQLLINRAKEAGTLAQVLDERDMFGWAPLHTAASCGKLAIVRLLLWAGANPNAADSKQSTPLHELAFSISHSKNFDELTALEILNELFAAQVKIDERDIHKWTPLYLAARSTKGNPFVEALKRLGAQDARRYHDIPIRVIVMSAALGHRPFMLPECPY